jgi:hypothetical protein
MSDRNDRLTKAVTKIQNRINEWTEVRCEEFIAQLKKSGDVFIAHAPSNRIVTENDIDKTKTINIKAHNLICYQPYREAIILRNKLEASERALRKAAELLKTSTSVMGKDMTVDQIVEWLKDDK